MLDVNEKLLFENLQAKYLFLSCPTNPVEMSRMFSLSSLHFCLQCANMCEINSKHLNMQMKTHVLPLEFVWIIDFKLTVEFK